MHCVVAPAYTVETIMWLANMQKYFKAIEILLLIIELGLGSASRDGLRQNSRQAIHPLDPLTAQEIQEAVHIVEIAAGIKYVYHYIALLEPPKAVLLPFFLSNESPPPGTIPRKAFLLLRDVTKVYEAVVNLDTAQRESYTQIFGKDTPYTPADYTYAFLNVVLNDTRVQKRCADLGYPNMNLIKGSAVPIQINDYNRPEWEGKRLVEFGPLYGQNFENDNFHAHPFDFAIIYDVDANAIVEIQDSPTHSDFSTNNTGNVAPRGEGNYDYELRGGKTSLRQDDNPITVSSPQGASYTINGNEIQWQKWKIRVGFNGREGLIMHTISYNDSGKHRPILYRGALSEIYVPYGDPREVLHRIGYFDMGQLGMGYHIVEQKLDEDVLGATAFIDSVINNANGTPHIIRNSISVREEDAGILWKHVNFRTKKGVGVRSHRLVVSCIATFTNYDYGFSWYFYQDGSIQFQVQLLGIMFTTMIAPGSKDSIYETQVAPQVGAMFHQHFFTARLDVDLDGMDNSVSTQDVIPVQEDTGSPSNPMGQGITTNQTVLLTAADGRTNIDPLKGRTWVIKNPNKINTVIGKPVGLKLIPGTMPPALMKKDSPYRKRAGYLDYDVWVTQFHDEQMYPGGFYLNNSGLPEWVDRNPGASIDNKDVVLWHTFGTCHITSPEQYPIMPSETVGFWLKPYNFFNENPAMDVPPWNTG